MKDENKIFYKTLIVSLFASVLLYGVASISLADSSQNYELDFGGVVVGSDNLRSPGFELQSGFSPIETNSFSPNFQITTINLIPICGNGIIELGERCDSPSFAGKTCSDFGFSLGNLTCVNCQTISTANCSNPPPPPPPPPSAPTAGGVVLPIFYDPVDSEEEDFDDEIIEEEADDGLYDEEFIDKDLIHDSAVDVSDFEIGAPIVLKDDDLQIETPVGLGGESLEFIENQNVFPKFLEWGINKTVDLNPVFIEQMEAFKEYTLYLRDLNTNEIISKTEIFSDSMGKIVFEFDGKLSLGKYVFELFDGENNSRNYYEFEVVEEIYSKFEIDSFVNIQNVDTDFAINGILNLGKILKTDEMFIYGKTAKNTRIDSFFQSRIFHVLEFSDEDGNFKIKIPNELSPGKHTLRIVQTYPDKTISDDLQFEFELVEKGRAGFCKYSLCVYIPLILSCVLYLLLVLKKR